MASKILPKQVEKFYSSELAYHNFSHVQAVCDQAQEIADYCQQEGKKVDKEVVYLAALLHDANYQADYRAQGFNSKEELAADLAEKFLLSNGCKQSLVDKVKETILGTLKDGKFISYEAKILRAADLSGLAGEYEDFVKNNQLLKSEYEFLNKKKVSNQKWRDMTKDLIEFYLSQNIHLTSRYYNKVGESVFYEKVRDNINRYLFLD